MRVLLLAACLSLLDLSYACSCSGSGLVAFYVCGMDHNIIKVKVNNIIEKAPEPEPPKLQEDPEEPLTTIPPYFHRYNYNAKREVDAVITKVYRGAARVGDHIRITTWMSDAMCGVGNWLHPDTILTFATNNLNEKSLNLCEYYAFKDMIPEEVLENTDCSCLGRC